MKKLCVKTIEYSGVSDYSGFILHFQLQAAGALKERGLLTEKKLEKALHILKGKWA